MQPVDPFADDWRAALELTRALGGGYQPQPVPAPFPLPPQEHAFAVLPVTVLRRVGIELAFADQSGSHAAAGRWQPADQGDLVLTNSRLAVASRAGRVVSFGWSGLARTWGEFDGTILDYGMAPDGSARRTKFCTGRPVWFDVLLNAVAFQRLVPRDVPPHLHRTLGVMRF